MCVEKDGKSGTEALWKALLENEGAVKALRECALRGNSEYKNEKLSNENIIGLLRFATAYYSWVVEIWGRVKGFCEHAEYVRKMKEASSYLSVRRSGTKSSVEDAKNEACISAEKEAGVEVEYQKIFTRINAAKISLEKFIDMANALRYMKGKEWFGSE